MSSAPIRSTIHICRLIVRYVCTSKYQMIDRILIYKAAPVYTQNCFLQSFPPLFSGDLSDALYTDSVRRFQCCHIKCSVPNQF